MNIITKLFASTMPSIENRKSASPAKVTPVAFFIGHVADRIDENQRRDRIDDHKHRPAQRIDGHADGNGQDVGNVDPGKLIGSDFAGLKEEPPAQRAGQAARRRWLGRRSAFSNICRRRG